MPEEDIGNSTGGDGCINNNNNNKILKNSVA
jgi:hypothetical protein